MCSGNDNATITGAEIQGKLTFRELVGAVFVKCCVAPASHLTFQSLYSPYAFVDIAVSQEEATKLFDALTHEMQLSGKIDLNDSATAMSVSAHGENNPARLGWQYLNGDGSKVGLSIFYRSIPTQTKTDYPAAYVPFNVKTSYDPEKTYVSLSLGFTSEGVARPIVSGKIVELIRLIGHQCYTAKLQCSIKARFVEAGKR